MENINCVSKSVWGFDGQECERESCDPECLPDEHLCDMGYNFDTGNLQDGTKRLFPDCVKLDA